MTDHPATPLVAAARPARDVLTGEERMFVEHVRRWRTPTDIGRLLAILDRLAPPKGGSGE